MIIEEYKIDSTIIKIDDSNISKESEETFKTLLSLTIKNISEYS